MIVLPLEHILVLHAIVLDETGRGEGLRDLGRLEATIATQTQNVFGEELYPNVSDKAAAIIEESLPTALLSMATSGQSC